MKPAIRYIGPDPRHVRPPTMDDLRQDVCGLYGKLLTLQRTSGLPEADAYRVAAGLVERLLWPVTV